MSQSPWKQGDREPFWVFGLQPDSGFLDISGLSESDFTLIFLPFVESGASTPRTGTGVFSDLTASADGSPATITYAPGAVDVATAGLFGREVVIKRGTSEQRSFDFGYWICEQ